MQVVVANNPSAMTIDGTNTYVLGPTHGSECLIIDPGPALSDHLHAILDAVGERTVAGVVVTHRHHDHAELVAPLVERTAAPVYALASPLDHPEHTPRMTLPSGRSGREALIPLADIRPVTNGDAITCEGVNLRVIATPGHTSDSLSLLHTSDGTLFTGDTVLGKGSTVVAWPDGNLAAYMASLHTLALVIEEHGITSIAPGHGPISSKPAQLITAYQRHRAERLRQVREALANGVEATPQAIVESVYADVPRSLWPAAELSARAQLDFLNNQN